MTQRLRTFRRPLALLAVALALGGCVYRINIQQGNFLKPEDVDRVQTGMTRSQVRFILGTPMVSDTFDTDRWDYYYYLVRGHSRHEEKRHVVVRFENDKVVSVERLLMPPSPAAPAQEKPSPTAGS